MTKKGKKKTKFTVKKFFKISFKIIRFIFSIPFYVIKFIYDIVKKTEKKKEKKKIKKKRDSIKSKYEKFKVVKTLTGDFDGWEKNIMKADSLIGIILGARGSGKSALAIKVFENLKSKSKKKLYAIGFDNKELPSWIKTVDTIDKIQQDSFVLIDEGGITFNSRNSMSKANKILSDLMLIARHKNISILFISQNSSNLEINILRQADYLILKKSSLMQKNFERKIISKIYNKTQDVFDKNKSDKGFCYIHSDDFMGFVSAKLPSFWSNSLSKSWKGK